MLGIDILDLGIDIDVWPWIWLVVAVVFAIVELSFVGGTFVLLPFAVSAFVAALVGFADGPIEAQWGTFVLGGAVLFFIAYRWVRRFISSHDLPAGVGADRLVGLVGFVTADIDPADTARRGRITVEGEVWGALTAGHVPVTAGTRVRVVEVIGTRVVVEPVKTASDGAADGASERSSE